MNHFTFILVGYNSAPWMEVCLKSVLSQDYENYDVIAVDALTNDGTFDILKKYEGVKNFKLFRNDVRKYQTENIEFGVDQAKDDSIIVTVDFDDWLPHDQVLNILNDQYDENTWLTYGCYSEYYGPEQKTGVRTDCFERYPDEIVETNRFREYRWLASHLRTFRKSLFQKIDRSDFIDTMTGKYFTMAGDMSFMYPMLEMCGEKFKYIDSEMYVYNRTNSLSDDRVDVKNQERQANLIKASKKYDRLETL